MGKNYKREAGNTLILILVVMAVGSMLVLGALRLADTQTLQVFSFFHREDALKHAELGYNKFLWELNQDSSCYLDATRYEKTVDTNEKTVYQPINQPTGDNYLVEIEIPVKQLDSSKEPVPNQVIIRSTGWTSAQPEHKRTLQVRLFKRSFAQFCMASDSEISPNGQKVYWTTGEYCYGPLHTNGTLYLRSQDYPVFYGPVTYGVGIDQASKASDASIFQGGQAKSPPLNWPSSNNKLMAVARTGGAGHYYLGRTCICLHEDGYDVRNWDAAANTWRYNGYAYEYIKKNDNEAYKEKGDYYVPSKAAYDNNEPGSAAYTKTYFAEFRTHFPRLPYPSNGVIYVDGSSQSSYATCTDKYNRTLGNVFVSGTLKGQLTIGSRNDIFICGYDPTDWSNPWQNGDKTVFSSFDYYGGVSYPSSSTGFSQVFNGSTWDHTEVTGSNRDDMLGLVADSNIYVLHYGWPTHNTETITSGNKVYASNGGWTNGSTSFPSQYDYSASGPDCAPANILIEGALFATRGFFGYENSDRGPEKGTITVFGSIAQHFRGTVGVIGASGYDKAYTHDPRMLYTSPPHYIEPANTGWQVGEWKELGTPVVKQ